MYVDTNITARDIQKKKLNNFIFSRNRASTSMDCIRFFYELFKLQRDLKRAKNSGEFQICVLFLIQLPN